MREPYAVWCNGEMLFVADSNNNRVLIWEDIETLTNGKTADIVVGQPDFTTSAQVLSATGLGPPGGVWADKSVLVVSDPGHGRVLIWHGIPSANGAAADTVLGQSDFVTGPDPAAPDVGDVVLFKLAAGVSVSGGRLFVADMAFHRVLAWNSIPLPGANGRPLDFVVGQGCLLGKPWQEPYARRRNGCSWIRPTLGCCGRTRQSLHLGQGCLTSRGSLSTAFHGLRTGRLRTRPDRFHP